MNSWAWVRVCMAGGTSSGARNLTGRKKSHFVFLFKMQITLTIYNIYVSNGSQELLAGELGYSPYAFYLLGAATFLDVGRFLQRTESCHGFALQVSAVGAGGALDGGVHFLGFKGV